MLKLLKVDLKRIFIDPLFRVACILGAAFGVIMPVMNYGVSLLINDMLGGEGIGELMTFDAKSIFFSSMLPSGDFGLLVPVFIIIALCRDFSQGTVRNKLISGHSRRSVFLSLFVTCSVYLCALVLVQGLIALGVSLIFFDYQAGGFGIAALGHLLLSVLFEIIVYAFISALISLLSVLMKSSGLAVILYIAVNFVLSLIGGIVQGAYEVMSVFEEESSSEAALEFFSKANPFSSGLIGAGTSYGVSDVLYIVLPPLVLGAMFVLLGMLVFEKKDLK